MKRLLLTVALFVIGVSLSSQVLAAESISFLGFYSISPEDGTDVWGFVDKDTGREYAVMGRLANGLLIIDVTDPTNPTLTASLPQVPGFDVKVWKHYAYTVTGHGSGFGAIINLSSPATPQVVGSFISSHNIFITDNGYMYLSSPGVRILDLNEDPTNPTEVWRGGSEGHDATVVGNRLYDFHGSRGTFIYDVSNPRAPTLLGSITDPTILYHHSGWPTEDGNYLFINDEAAEHPFPDITVWDIRDPGNPERVGEYGDPFATVHNLFVIGNYAYTSYYYAGFRVFNISDPTTPIPVAEFDTSPVAAEGFGGAFGVYPFAPSGNIYVSDQAGLYIFGFSGGVTDVNDAQVGGPASFALDQNFPNPFNSETEIIYHLPLEAEVSLVIYNVLGRPVRHLVDGVNPAGSHTIVWDGVDDAGDEVGTGYYIVRLRVGSFLESRKMLLLR
jgi:choice-of-anchor B domain-containing protein